MPWPMISDKWKEIETASDEWLDRFLNIHKNLTVNKPEALLSHMQQVLIKLL